MQEVEFLRRQVDRRSVCLDGTQVWIEMEVATAQGAVGQRRLGVELHAPQLRFDARRRARPAKGLGM